jgi:hypothetical protein
MGDQASNCSRESCQSVSLTADEWISYSVNSPIAKPCSVVIRAQATSLPAAFIFSCNDQREKVALNDRTWTKVKGEAVKAVQGANRMELRVKGGTILFDWVDIEWQSAIGHQQVASVLFASLKP